MSAEIPEIVIPSKGNGCTTVSGAANWELNSEDGISVAANWDLNVEND